MSWPITRLMVSVPIIVVVLLSVHGAGAVTPLGDPDHRYETRPILATRPVAWELRTGLPVTGRRTEPAGPGITAGQRRVTDARSNAACGTQLNCADGYSSQ